jgi:hypothetical protein
MSLRQGMPAGAGCVFREDFLNTLAVNDQGGVIVASTVDRGISPLGVSARVTYDQTQGLLCNATKATIVMRFRTGVVVVDESMLHKEPSALNNNCFTTSLSNVAGNNRLSINVAASAADTSIYAYHTQCLANSEYTNYFVFDGALVGNARMLAYVNGLPVVLSYNNIMPAVLRSSSVPLTVFNRAGGTLNAPQTDFIMRQILIFDTAFSPAEVADSYASIAMQEITPQ